MSKQKSQTKHLPVLTKEVIDCLDPRAGESYLDLTAGYGGHAELVLERTNAPSLAVLVDRDREAVEHLQSVFPETQVTHSDFLDACQQLVEQGKRFDMILADLGLSSPHLDLAERGFSLRLDGPLDMRMDRRQELRAEELVNRASEARLIKILHDYGEEPRAHRMARAIVTNRPITTTVLLAQVIAKVGGNSGRRQKIHPATRVFQALRIAVNDELDQLSASLPLLTQLLAPGGRLAIISFHSLEDRLVKQFLAEQADGTYTAELSLLTKKPTVPTTEEIVINPRARSAKLRAAAKIKTIER